MTRTSNSSAGRLAVAAIAALTLHSATPAYAAISWDGEGGTNWWFDPVNWSSEGDVTLPPGQPVEGGGVETTDAQINIGTGAWDLTGEGVVYDPDNDPNFAAAGSLPFPPGGGPQDIDRFYLARNTDVTNLATFKSGDLEASRTIVGRSGGPGNLGILVQTGGSISVPTENISIAAREQSGIGNGIWDYRGGVLNVASSNGEGIRLSVQSNEGGGTGGHARFIMHNPDTGGFVRTWQLRIAAGAQGDGVDTGVAIMEYHYENGGTRPIQIDNSIGSLDSLTIGNGANTDGTPGMRSSRLELNLGEAPDIDEMGVPNNVGLLSIASASQSVVGAGTEGGVFRDARGLALLPEGASVAADFGGVTYEWTISYTGAITWSDRDNSVVGSVTGTGTGNDVVLIGAGSSGLAGDFNADGVVDAADYVAWRNDLVDPFDATADYNTDTLVNFDDFQQWKTASLAGTIAAERDAFRANYGATAGMAAAIPEPAAAWLVMLAAGAAVVRRRRDA